MKIVLVLPDQTHLDELKGWWYPPPIKRNRKMSLPSLGMLYLCAAIKSDYEVVYIDNALERLSDELLADRITALRPDVVGFGGTNQEWPQASSVAEAVKRAMPETITIYGGPNATARPEKHIHYFDYVFRGTAEHALKAFLDRLELKQSPVGIDGLCAKTFDTIAAPATVQDLDTLPWPDRGRIDLNAYQRESHGLPAPVDVVVTSRGCPYDCRFCSAQFIWNRRYLKRSAESVLEEIRFMKEVYGSRALHFREDNLTVDRDRLRLICDGLAKMGLQWTCQSRINSLNEDMVRMMKDCGCKLISCGFESVNDATLRYLRKRQTAAQIFNIIDIFERVGVHYTGGFIVASPNETRQDIINTIRFAQELSTFPHSRITPTATRFVGIPVSELYYKIIEDGLVEYNWQDGELLFPRTYAMSSAAIDELLAETYASGSSWTDDEDAEEVQAVPPMPTPIDVRSVPKPAVEPLSPQMQLYQYKKSDGTFDYERYRTVQVEANKQKLHKVWVQEDNIRFLSEYIRSAIARPAFGLCHGTRRGKEQEWFRKYLGCDVLGTEISDTAVQFPYTIQWDFHEVKPEWINAVDFIYSNSFDHSYDPDKCLNAWMSCLTEEGVCILEHTSGHEEATEMDPFGARLSQMPELVKGWGRGKFAVHEIIDGPKRKEAVEYVKYIIVKRTPSPIGQKKMLAAPSSIHRDKKTALITAMPQRLESLRYVLRSIQPQVDEIRILINNTAQAPTDLASMDKVTTVRTDPAGSLYASGVWTLLRQDDNGYLFILDDDIVYPPDYADIMIAAVERHKRKAVAVVHGMDYREPFNDCIDDRIVYRFQKAHPTESVVHTGGVGTLVFHTDTLRPTVADFPNPNFRDLWFSILTAQKKIPILCVARAEGWLRQIQTADQSLWQMSQQADWRRRKNEIFRTQLVPLLKAQPAAAGDTKFSVFSITNGRSTFEYSHRSLKKAYTGEITVLRDMRWLEALNACVQRCTTPYFFRMDDDFIVHPAALAYMQKQVLAYPEPDKLGIYYCHLWEDWTQRVRESIKVYSVAALRAIGGFHADDKGKVDRVTNRMLEEAGFRVVGDPSAVALHACGDWQEQLNYESLWCAMAAAPYKKPTHEAMKAYCGSKTLDQQYAMRKGFLERLNHQLNTPFHRFIQSSSLTTTASPVPKVSVVLACHNEEKYLAECLDSLLAQTLTEWELLAVDDASTDNTRRILQDYAARDKRIRVWFFDDQTGPYVRRNFAIGQSRAPFISIQDADDIMMPQKLATLYQHISQDPRLGIVGSWYRRFLEKIHDVEFGDCMKQTVSHEELMRIYPNTWYLCWHGSAIIRKSLFEQIGFYDEQPWGSDAFWLSKAGLYGYLTGKVHFRNIPECLTFKRDHSGSQTGTIIYEDPRSRRHRHKAYFRQKLAEIADAYKADPTIDLAARLRACNVNDFIPRFGQLFGQWESEPVTDAMLQSVWAQIHSDMQQQWYVSAAIKFNVLEKLDCRIAERCPDFTLFRALAYYAAGHDDKARHEMMRLPQTQQTNIDFTITAAAERKRRVAAFYAARLAPASSAVQVSVIMPAYNAAAYIKEAIDSVLAQTEGRFELIVINDGSTDATESIVKSYTDSRVRLLSQSNAGPSSARNAGLRQAKGDFIVFLDSDDRLTPDFIAQHLAAFDRTPKADLVYCDDALVDENGRPLRVIERAEYPDHRRLIADLFRNGYPVVPFRTCIRRSVFDKIGLYDERLGVSEDYDMLRRFIRHGLVAVHLKGAFYVRRMTTQSQSRSLSREKAGMHFEAIQAFAETFSGSELFCDVEWTRIPPERRVFQLELLVAKTFIAIGQSYGRTDAAGYFLQMAAEYAVMHLEKCLNIVPEDTGVAILLDKCRRYCGQSEAAVR